MKARKLGADMNKQNELEQVYLEVTRQVMTEGGLHHFLWSSKEFKNKKAEKHFIEAIREFNMGLEALLTDIALNNADNKIQRGKALVEDYKAKKRQMGDI
jgi:hypothetical protein